MYRNKILLTFDRKNPKYLHLKIRISKDYEKIYITDYHTLNE
ncbi:hypothetical protein RBEAN4_0190 [Rickettsia bellii str. RML An4]|uniref:Uncharacterized protein n=1 Tax=Rickettsia bellii str. RML An4 TaxID=1359193 RepID=A0A0F3Q9H5_RICBE|nr:hypothetical protein RBEAN4_0190 [Rickettsia bellii str. RML An4]